jgi:hypothetical protein
MTVARSTPKLFQSLARAFPKPPPKPGRTPAKDMPKLFPKTPLITPLGFGSPFGAASPKNNLRTTLGRTLRRARSRVPSPAKSDGHHSCGGRRETRHGARWTSPSGPTCSRSACWRLRAVPQGSATSSAKATRSESRAPSRCGIREAGTTRRVLDRDGTGVTPRDGRRG